MRMKGSPVTFVIQYFQDPSVIIVTEIVIIASIVINAIIALIVIFAPLSLLLLVLLVVKANLWNKSEGFNDCGLIEEMFNYNTLFRLSRVRPLQRGKMAHFEGGSIREDVPLVVLVLL